MTDPELCFTSPAKLARLIRTRKISATEVVRAFIAQIERVNPGVNAIVTFLPERALREARKLDRRLANRRTAAAGPLAGLPIAYKDLVATKGIRTTLGSRVYADNVPAENHLIVERLQGAGVITLGKTNTPEFGAGSQTFNKVFGATRNPYDLSKTAGGSSGGAAAAVACGMLPFADGSDLAASLRNPGNYCNVVGFRPTPGRVPNAQGANIWDSLAVLGPIGRTVADAALLLSAMAGPDPRVPLSIDEPGRAFHRPLARNFRRVRVAWTPDFNGLPTDRRVTDVLEAQRSVFQSLGCAVEEACPDFSGATEAFETLRAISFVQRYAPLLASRRNDLKDTVIWNIEQGLALDGSRVARATALHSELFTRMQAFLVRHEFLVAPVNQLPPYPVEIEWPREIAGVRMGNYLDWMKSCYYITITGHPAISVPAGFTPEGLPVGIQIVGRYGDDFGVLQLAHAFESANEAWKRRPAIASN
jgi:amidase